MTDCTDLELEVTTGGNPVVAGAIGALAAHLVCEMAIEFMDGFVEGFASTQQ